jgi:predicted secreted protein|tara:strand:+ start:719 stop:1168 length:450 start_codon:yes stop_codon:yes gene_type:complete
MAINTIITGNNGVVKMADASNSQTSIASVRSFSLEITSDTIESTTMGTDSRTYLKGLSSFSGTAEIYYDGDVFPTADSGTNLSGLNPTLQAVGTSPYLLELFPDEASSNTTKFSGNVIITGFTLNSSMDGMVEASISFQGSGGVTYANS